MDGHEHLGFDERADTWDDPDKVARAREVADAIAGSLPVRPGGTRVLEYGAGTGLVSEALQHRVGPLTLADSSTGMRRVMQAKVAAGALPGARVWDLDLERRPAPAPAEEFDLVVASMVLHHVRDLPTVLGGLVGLLAPGGHLAVADLDREDGSFHGHGFQGHEGFERAELAAGLLRAGLVDVGTADCGSITREGTAYPVFLATGRRP
jgi:predicted TPR repeat methyltransferase